MTGMENRENRDCGEMFLGLILGQTGIFYVGIVGIVGILF